MDGTSSGAALGYSGLPACSLLFWSLLGHSHSSPRGGLDKGDGCSTFLCRTACCNSWQAYAVDPPNVRHGNGDQLRTAGSTAGSSPEALAWNPDGCRSWHCPAHVSEAGIVGVDRHYWSRCSSRSSVIRSGLGTQWVVVGAKRGPWSLGCAGDAIRRCCARAPGVARSAAAGCARAPGRPPPRSGRRRARSSSASPA